MLTEDATTTIEDAGQRSESWGTQEQAAWYAIYTRSHFENLVADQLTSRGFSLFLPQTGVWSKRLRTSRVVPMFPGYLFIHHGMEKRSYIEILKARGVVRVLEGGWNRLTPIADVEMEGIQRVVNAGVPVSPHMYFNQGDRVRVFDGRSQASKASSCVTSRTKVARRVDQSPSNEAWRLKWTPRSWRLRMRRGIGMRFVLTGVIVALSSRSRWRLNRNRV